MLDSNGQKYVLVKSWSPNGEFLDSQMRRYDLFKRYV
jgi:hypothetical protein